MPSGSASDGRRRAAVLRREDGQVFVFVTTLLFALFVLVGTVINVGQATTRRMYVQMLADAGAYTGATEMARGMNTIAGHNKSIQRAWTVLNGILHVPPLPKVPCVIRSLAVKVYRGYHATQSMAINRLNEGYAARAYGEAKRVTDFGANELFDGERISYGESNLTFGIKSNGPETKVVDLREIKSGVFPKAVTSPFPGLKTLPYVCLGVPPGRVARKMGLWYKKANRAVVDFAWAVSVPARPFRVLSSLFGSMPKMEAAARAKPVGGDIERGRQWYVAKMLPVRDQARTIPDLRKFGKIRKVWH